jgi:hypothetical protein
VAALPALLTLAVFGLNPLFWRLEDWRATYVAERKDRIAAVRQRQPAAPGQAGRSGLTLVSAHYGANDTWVDVSAQVRAHLHDNRIDMQATNEALGGDPLLNVAKVLKVTYFVGSGARRSVTVEENERLTIP